MARAWTMGIGRAAGLQGLLKGLSKGYTRPHSRDRCRLSYCELVGFQHMFHFLLASRRREIFQKATMGSATLTAVSGDAALDRQGRVTI